MDGFLVVAVFWVGLVLGRRWKMHEMESRLDVLENNIEKLEKGPRITRIVERD